MGKKSWPLSLLAIFLLVSFSSCDETDILCDYIENLTSKIDKTKDPCENFEEYVCGKATDKTRERVYNLAEQYLVESEPKTAAEKQAKHFYLSCKIGSGADVKKVYKQIDAFQLLGSFPIQKDINDKQIAELLGKLGVVSFLWIHHKGNINFENKNLTLSILYNDHDVEQSTLSKNLNDFYSRMNSIRKREWDPKISTIKSLDELKEKLPNFDWDTYLLNAWSTQGISLTDYNPNGYTFLVDDIDRLQQQFRVITSTDKTTLANYALFRALDHIQHADCMDLQIYTLLLNFKKIMENTTLEDNNKQIAGFNSFSEYFRPIQTQIYYSDTAKARIDLFLESRVKMFSRNEELRNSLEEFYEKFEPMNTDTFFANVINIANKFDNVKFLSSPESKLSSILVFHDILHKYRNSYNEFVIKNMPMLYIFASRNYIDWRDLLDLDKFLEDKTVSRDCLRYKDEGLEHHFNKEFIKALALLKLAYSEYLTYFAKNKEEAELQNRVFEEYGLTSEKAWFLSVYQNFCDKYNSGSAFYILEKSKEFSTAFGCNATFTKKNTCPIEEVTANNTIKNLDFMLKV